MHVTPPALFALLLQLDLVEMISHTTPLGYAVYAILIGLSLYSWTVIFSKLGLFNRARETNNKFLRAFRKAPDFQSVVVASEQYRPSPLVSVFDFGYEEVHRQVKSRGSVRNKMALERSLQLGMSEELAKLERNLNWLATTAAISPFVGLFGTVIGIMRSFHDLGAQGAMSLKAVAPGISEALFATAIGLVAAIHAVIFYNHFVAKTRVLESDMENFSNDFLNIVKRHFFK